MANRYIVMGQLYITNVTSGVSVTGRVVVDSAFTCTGAGTFTVDMANGTTGSISGTNVQGSPVALSAGANTITTTGAVADGQIDITIGTAANTDSVNTYSATSGGACGASIPTSVDNLYGDANSFTAGSQVLTVNAALSVKDFIWTNATNSPTLAFGTSLIHVYASATFISAMAITRSSGSALEFNGTGNFTTGGLTIGQNIQIYGGTITLQDALNQTSSYNLNLYTGTLDTNNQTVTCKTFAMNGAPTLTPGSSIINCTAFTGVGTLTPNTATINCSGNFSGGGITTYNIVNLTGATSIISGNNTFNTLALPSGTTQSITFTDGSTQTATTFTLSGDATHTHTLQGSSTAGWYLSQKYGNKVSCDYVSVSRSTISSSGKFYAGTHSTNGGNNTKWEFSDPPSIKTKQSYDKQALNSGMVLDLPGYEATGATIHDISKYHNNGTITGATWSQLASGLWVLSFDGIDDYITIPHNSSLDLIGNFTFSFWFRTSILSDYCMYMKGSVNVEGLRIALGSQGYMEFRTYQSGGNKRTFTNNSTIAINTWYHICMVRNGTSGKIYVNLVDKTNGGSDAQDNAITSSRSAYVGTSDTGTLDLAGYISFLKVFNTEKSLNEIGNIYNQERSLFGV